MPRRRPLSLRVRWRQPPTPSGFAKCSPRGGTGGRRMRPHELWSPAGWEEAAEPACLDRLRAPVVAWAGPWCRGAQHEAEDLAQDVMVRVLARRHQFRGDGRLAAWVYVIGRNLFVSRTRSASRRDRSERFYASDSMHCSASPEVAPSGWQPSGGAARLLRLWAASEVISEEERSAIDLVVLRN
ncbi:MAG: RNA polymerase sigma factor [Longimicrobiales bacterium]